MVVGVAMTLMMNSCKPKSLTEGLPQTRGVAQAAALWTEEDGNAEEFRAFVEANLCKTGSERLVLFESLSRIMEKCNESADMLELIRDSLWFDFAYLNSVSLNDINHLFNNSISKGKEITSAFEAQKEKIEKNLAKLLDGYASLKQ